MQRRYAASYPALDANADKSRGDDACWIWTGRLNDGGYGVTPRKGDLAHRVAWERAKGPIIRGAMICHRCDNRKCVNPAHLFPGSSLANTRDMLAKGRSGQRQGKLRTVAIKANRQIELEVWQDANTPDDHDLHFGLGG